MNVEDKLAQCNLMLEDIHYIITEAIMSKNPDVYAEVVEDLNISVMRMGNVLARVEYLLYGDSYDDQY
jgi:hypothetical protein